MMRQPSYDVVIVGAGVAGLAAANILTGHGVSCLVLESSGRVGGRIKTDDYEGFQLDYGFQVFLPAYPEARQLLDYDELALHSFYSGALIRLSDGNFHKVADPWRHPVDGLQSIYNRVGTLKDKLKVAKLRQRLLDQPGKEYLRHPEITTAAYLQAEGFSKGIIDSFFRPFFAGIFLEPDLQTSSRFFEFVFRMFSLEGAALPARGMRAIPEQLAAGLPADTVRVQVPVAVVESGRVRLAGGDTIQAKAIILATDAGDLNELLPRQVPTTFNAVQCVYFSTPTPPVTEPILVLNGVSDSLINNFCVPSQVCRSYAPAGQSLLSVSVLGDRENDLDLADAVKTELKTWFGAQVMEWRHLRTYNIRKALPRLTVPDNSLTIKAPWLTDGLYLCGDYLDTPSINGAMASGRRAAEAVLQKLQIPAKTILHTGVGVT